jgi:GNAT superfamily N-acetyltransferase
MLQWEVDKLEQDTMELNVFNALNKPSEIEKQEIINFLYDHLEEFGDPRTDIRRAVDYSIKEFSSFGGFTLVGRNNGSILGTVVVNQTGMKGYIPENILVYIATHKDHRGKGYGKKLMNKTLELAHGNVALHVEPENPAKFLYEKIGFTNKYLEMRYQHIE